MAIKYVERPFAVTKSSGGSVSMTQESGTTNDHRIVTARTVMDDGAGAFPGGWGTVSYASKSVNLKVVTFDRSASTYKADHEDAREFSTAVADGSGSSGGNSAKGGSYGSTTVGEEVFAGSSIVATYRTGAGTPTAKSMSYTPALVSIDLCPYTVDRIVPGSVRFVWMGTTYEDADGVLYRGRSDASPGIISGRVDYASGHALMSDYVVGPNPGSITLLSLWTSKGEWRTASAFFMTDASPIQPGQITITCLDVAGNQIEVTCALDGTLSGPHATGKFEFQNGLAQLQFGDFVLDSSLSVEDKQEWWYDPADVGAVEPLKIWRPWPIDPASLRYNAVSNLYLPVDPEILGLNPTRLPQDGRVPIFAKGRMVCIGHNAQIAPTTYANSDVIDCGRTRLSHVWLIDANGELINEGFTATEADLDAGRVHVTDVSGWAQPVTVEHRIQDMRLCTDVQIDGTVAFNFPLSHDFPEGSVVSSVLLFGTKFARVASVFDQQSWDGVTWADNVDGNPAVASYNDAAYPIAVTNAGALTERYALKFKADATTFDLIGEFSGGLGQGSKNVDFSPGNPFSLSTPLFELAAAGWGNGWVAGNTVFVRLEAAMSSMAVIRTVQPSVAAGTDYSFDLLAGGDVDRPPSAP
ncbi:hypothetical protein [Comamonas sp. NLF-1-9]|uniref:hypothetical protein n=1 Tax=Comamonas sp. NLF-1-9 TaxID=2853163 RepID=UPI001C468402|nr:hypothetical protein [Comamonas sp. NLF-1-9]QXL84090.1 hypothetical protein KUD94_12750 [Comamonas sp. NLF-1-9]